MASIDQSNLKLRAPLKNITSSLRPSFSDRLLEAALTQFGPWSEKSELNVDVTWVSRELDAAINNIDWPKAAEDVNSFLRPAEAKSLELWSAPFFVSKLNKLIATAPQT